VIKDEMIACSQISTYCEQVNDLLVSNWIVES